MVSLLSMNDEQLRDYLSKERDLVSCAKKLYNSCISGRGLTELSASEMTRIGLSNDEQQRIVKLISMKGISDSTPRQQQNGWPKQQSQQPRSKRDPWSSAKESVIDRAHYINPTTRKNPHVWYWNDTSINSSGIIIIANIDSKVVYNKQHVVDILEMSGLSRNNIIAKTINICQWRAYVMLKNPKDVIKLKRFSKIKFPSSGDGKLVYIVHTPRRAFMRSGNWPLDLLFVIYHEKLESEYHDILDYTKTIPGELHYAIAAMVKLSEEKTIVVLYRRRKYFKYLTQISHACKIKKIGTPSPNDLSELTIILNSTSHDPEKGWKFTKRSKPASAAKSAAREFMTHYANYGYPALIPAGNAHYATINPELNYYPSPNIRFRSRWTALSQTASMHPMELTASRGWMGGDQMGISERLLHSSPMSLQYPRKKSIRHVLTPLNVATHGKPRPPGSQSQRKQQHRNNNNHSGQRRPQRDQQCDREPQDQVKLPTFR
jgi:hypothetical protein